MTEFKYPGIGESLYHAVLPNGLRISVIPKPGYSRCVAMFAAEYGGADRRFRLAGEYIDTPAGVAHFLEHKMFDMPGGDNAMAYFAANGAQPNAFTASGITAYYFESTDDFYGNLRQLLRFVSTPYFTDESVQKEQGIIAQEIRMCEDNPDYVVYDELTRCLYEHNPIRDSVAGTVESIACITPEILYNCHKVFYNPGNMCLSVVGDVSPQRVEAIACELLPASSGELPGRDYGEKESLIPYRTRFQRAMDVSAPQFLFGSKLSPAPKGPELLRQKLIGGLALSYLLGQSSPFYTRLYEQGLLNTDFSYSMDSAAGVMSILAGGESREPERVMEELGREVEKLSRSGLDEKLWSGTRKALYGSRIRALSSFFGMCTSMVDAGFSGYNCLDSFQVVESITKDEVLTFIEDAFAPDRLAVSVIIPSDGKGAAENA